MNLETITVPQFVFLSLSTLLFAVAGGILLVRPPAAELKRSGAFLIWLWVGSFLVTSAWPLPGPFDVIVITLSICLVADRLWPLRKP